MPATIQNHVAKLFRGTQLAMAAVACLVLARGTAIAKGAAPTEIPTELFTCGRQCYEIEPHAIMIDCQSSGYWLTSNGRNWWGPLRCVGPIQIAIQARPLGPPVETLPLYVEIRGGEATPTCEQMPGKLVWQTYGTSSCDADSMWVVSPVIDLLGMNAPLNGTYWIQLVGFERLGPNPPNPEGSAASPFRGCLRVTSLLTGVREVSWGSMKTLYR